MGAEGAAAGPGREEEDEEDEEDEEEGAGSRRGQKAKSEMSKVFQHEKNQHEKPRRKVCDVADPGGPLQDLRKL